MFEPCHIQKQNVAALLLKLLRKQEMYFTSPNYDELHLINKTQFVKEGFGVTEEFFWELYFFFSSSS